MTQQNLPDQQLFRRSTIQRNLTLDALVERLADVFRAYARDEARMPAKNYLYFPDHDGDLRTMSAYVPDLNLATVKIVNAHPENPERHELPTVMALLVAVDPRTGVPRAVMDATEITALRTAAASALATRTMSPPDVESLGLIGAGAQAPYQIRGQLLVRDFKRLILYDLSWDRADALARRMDDEHPELEVVVADTPRDVLKGAAVITTITPSREPLIPDLTVEGLPDRLHVNAMGADAPDKQEWPRVLVEHSDVVIDDWQQASHSGEISRWVEEGFLSRADLRGTLGELLCEDEFRLSERTVFDSTGLAIQDTAAAAVLLEGNVKPDTQFSFLD